MFDAIMSDLASDFVVVVVAIIIIIIIIIVDVVLAAAAVLVAIAMRTVVAVCSRAPSST